MKSLQDLFVFVILATWSSFPDSFGSENGQRAVRKTFPHLILLVLGVFTSAWQEIFQGGMRMPASTPENFSEVSGFLWQDFAANQAGNASF